MDKRSKIGLRISELESQIDWMEEDLADAKEELRQEQEELYKLDN